MRISPCAVTLGHFNAPGALASLISWHLGQLKASLSHHRAPVTSLAVVQPNLRAFLAPLCTPPSRELAFFLLHRLTLCDLKTWVPPPE